MISSTKKICIVGAGGSGRETLCLLKDAAPKGANLANLACFMVLEKDLTDRKIMGVDVITEPEFDPALYDVVVAIGDPQIRKKVVAKMPAGTTYTTLIHPSVIMSDWVEIGAGSIIAAGTILTCNIRIGSHSHCNLHTTVGHDCVTADFFTTAQSVNISGDCKFEECVYLGANSAVKQGVRICENVTIGMGGVVVKNITEPGVYIGNPVKKLEKN